MEHGRRKKKDITRDPGFRGYEGQLLGRASVKRSVYVGGCLIDIPFPSAELLFKPRLPTCNGRRNCVQLLFSMLLQVYMMHSITAIHIDSNILDYLL